MNNFLPTFINNPKFIAYVVVFLTIFITFFLFLLLKSKIKNQHFLKTNYIITYIFIIAVVFSLIFLIISNFKTVGDDNEQWLTYAFYFGTAMTSIVLTVIFLLSMFLLVFRYIYTISFLLEDNSAKKRIINITFFYVLNATIAILVTCICYFLKDSFFKYDFNVQKLYEIGYTKFYYYTRYLFIYVIMKPNFSFYLIIALIGLISITFIILWLLRRNNYRLYVKTITFTNKFIDKFKWQDKILPLFVFTATSTSLLSQPIATLLHISLILILFLIFSLIIGSMNWIISYNRLKNYINFKKTIKSLSINLFKVNSDQSLFDVVFKNEMDLTYYKSKQKHTFFYKILSICIFPIIITGYLGFCSTGPLLRESTPWMNHLWFWITLFIIPYILSYAFIFPKASVSPYKILINMSTSYISSSFNSGILIYFNPIIYKISQYAIFGYQLMFLNPKTDIKKINKRK